MVMPFVSQGYEQPILRSWPSGTVTDETTYLGPFWPGEYPAFRFEVDLETENGTHTLDMEFQYFMEANGDYTDWLDGAGTVIKINNYANGETGHRFIEVGPGATGGADADKVLAVGNNTYYDSLIVPQFRIKVVRGGTAVDDVISASIFWRIR